MPEHASDHEGLAELSRAWTKLGEEEPLWAVYVDPAKKGGRWDVGEFLATGTEEIGLALAGLARMGLTPGREAALDFGCGVGRLTAALTPHFGAVTGVDISATMLSKAAELHGANDHCQFVQNDRPDLSLFADDSFDLVYCSLVLQHMVPALSDGYIREFVRVVRPGGAIVFIVPQRHLRTPRGLVYAYAPFPLIALLQRWVFGFPAPMRMHNVPAERVRALVEPLGARLAGTEPRPWPGHWQMAAVYVSVPG